MTKRKKVVLAYSGGLDTSVILKWLDLQGYDVTAFVADLGQRDDLSMLEAKAKASGAKEFFIGDLKEEFVRDFVFPSIRFNALYEGRYMLGTSLARPLIAKGLVDTAHKIQAKYISHGATGKGNDQVRFELTAAALDPELKVIVPWRMPEFYDEIKGRAEAMIFARKHNIPIKATAKKPWSSDENAMHISFEAGILEDPAATPPDDMFEYSVSPKMAPDKAEVITLLFEQGTPVELNGQKLSPYNMLTELNKIGGRNGVGRMDMVESRYVGMKSRGVYETPGGTILVAAHRDLEGLTLEGNVIQLKETLMPRFAQLVYSGYWYCSEMDCLMALLNESQKYVTGKVTLELYKGGITALSRESKYSLYNMKVVSMDDDQGAFDQSLATGFIKLHAIPLAADSRRKRF
ncbi:MAG: argininosuccinate synthase [Deferribacteraceae bacterium]|jgi:argininosuccinate synthase|nr:argininosuccinate synthase [Deferribacteraceae bacterium]